MHRGARATLLVVWLLVLAGLGWMVSQRLHVSSDLRSFMPAPTTPDQRLLMEQVGEGPGSRLLLLSISGASDGQLASLSQGLAAALKKDARYSQVLNGSFDLSSLDPQLLPYRYLLSPTLDTQPLGEAYLADQLQQRQRRGEPQRGQADLGDHWVVSLTAARFCASVMSLSSRGT